jgi:hypothetical protein
MAVMLTIWIHAFLIMQASMQARIGRRRVASRRVASRRVARIASHGAQ